MIVTNKLNLPDALVSAVSNRRHNAPHCYSATTLLKDAKEVILTERHFDEIEVDCADSIWQVFGTAVHSLLENKKDSCLHEYRVESEINGNGISKGTKITGIIDSVDVENGILADWKTASVWKVIHGDFSDWKRQGLVYTWLLSTKGIYVNKCRFVALLKDHSKAESARDKSYPQSPVYVYEFIPTVSDLDEVYKWILSKVQEFEAASCLSDDDIIPCSAENRWQTPTVYAVKKEGRKTAVKLCETLGEAENYIADKTDGKGYSVEIREGVCRKCKDYCVCQKFCNYYNKEMAECQI